GKISLIRAARASGSRSGAPDLAIITGSTTTGTSGVARSRPATAAMMGAVDNIPILTASASKSERTASHCSTTNSGGRFKTPVTPTEFWAVTAVITDMPNTRKAENVLRSAWMPAPPPESDPAMVSALGTPMSDEVYAAVRGATTAGAPGRRQRADNMV